MSRSLFLSVITFFLVSSSLQAINLKLEVSSDSENRTITFLKKDKDSDWKGETKIFSAKSTFNFNENLMKCFKNLEYLENKLIFTGDAEENKELSMVHNSALIVETVSVSCRKGDRFFQLLTIKGKKENKDNIIL